MRIINVLGVILFFFPIFVKYYSIRAFLVLANGILYHMNETNLFFRFWDILWNLIMCFYTYTLYKPALYYIVFSFSCFFLNFILLQKKMITKNQGDFFHVMFIQLPLSICLEKSLAK